MSIPQFLFLILFLSCRESVDSSPQLPDVVKLNVGGREFVTSYTTLCKDHGDEGDEESYLMELSRDRRLRDMPIYVDSDPDTFPYILDYLRYGRCEVPEFWKLWKLLAEGKRLRLKGMVKYLYDESGWLDDEQEVYLYPQQYQVQKVVFINLLKSCTRGGEHMKRLFGVIVYLLKQGCGKEQRSPITILPAPVQNQHTSISTQQTQPPTPQQLIQFLQNGTGMLTPFNFDIDIINQIITLKPAAGSHYYNYNF